MPDWLAIFLACGGSALIGAIVSVLVKTPRKIWEKQEKQWNERIMKQIGEQIAPLADQMNLIATGTQATLRNDLLNCYYDCKKKGYRTAEDIQNFADMYAAYRALKGNSFIEQIAKIFTHIPTETDYKKGE